MSKRWKRGSTLILALFVVLIIFVAGLGFLSQASTQFKLAGETGRTVQALALAEAGVQDALLKLRLDWDFPPKSAQDQLVYTYLNPMLDTEGNQVGSYQVAIDRSVMNNDRDLLVIRSTGRLGPPEEPFAERTVVVEFDMKHSRPTYFQVLTWTDLGGF